MEKDIKVKSAAEAFDLARKNFVSYDQVMENISMAAKNGGLYFLEWNHITDEVRNKLLSSGFKLSETKGPSSEKLIKIEWLP